MAEETQSRTPGPNKLPKRYLQFQKRYPQVFQAYDALGAATAEAGPLSDKTRALVRLAIAVGGQMEGGTSRILEIRELTFTKQRQGSNFSRRIQSDSLKLILAHF